MTSRLPPSAHSHNAPLDAILTSTVTIRPFAWLAIWRILRPAFIASLSGFGSGHNITSFRVAVVFIRPLPSFPAPVQASLRGVLLIA